jgi:hypothetical protein
MLERDSRFHTVHTRLPQVSEMDDEKVEDSGEQERNFNETPASFRGRGRKLPMGYIRNTALLAGNAFEEWSTPKQ